MGTMYLHGDGVHRDKDKANQLLTLASKQGHVNANAFLNEVSGGTRKTKVSKIKYRKHHSDVRSRNRRRIVKSKSKSKTKRRQKK